LLTLFYLGDEPPPRVAGTAMLRSGQTSAERIAMNRDRLLRDLGWLAEGNPRYVGTEEEGRQNPELAKLMADDLLLSYIGDREVTAVFNEIRRGHSP
jgi:hypothetical protein